jgi:hypothetical protein
VEWGYLPEERWRDSFREKHLRRVRIGTAWKRRDYNWPIWKLPGDKRVQEGLVAAYYYGGVTTADFGFSNDSLEKYYAVDWW